jgi:hypothetical protein
MTDFGLHVSPAIIATNLFTANTYLQIGQSSIWKLFNNPLYPGDTLTCGELNWNYQYLIGTGGSPRSKILLLRKYYLWDTLWIPTYSSISSPFTPEDIAIYYNYNLFICGNNGKIFTSIDDRSSWSEQITGINSKLNSIEFGYNDSVGYSVGDNGMILSASNGGGNNIVNEQIQPNEFYLYQNYPNPFNPSTSIRFRIAERSNVSLIVFDILGREIACLVKEEKLAGEYSVEFNPKELVSGIYFYQLKDGNYTTTRKMTLVK